jgi:penicillin-binding protein 1A
LQKAANRAVVTGLEEYDKRHGYRGPEARIDLQDKSTPADWNEALTPFRPVSGLVPGLVTEVEDNIALVYLPNGQNTALELEGWAAPFISRDRVGNKPKSLKDVFAPGDVIRTRMDDAGTWKLGQVPEVESALVSMNPTTGEIVALVGGYDFTRSKYNRITQSRRQLPSSSFKPLFIPPLDKGIYYRKPGKRHSPIVFDGADAATIQAAKLHREVLWTNAPASHGQLSQPGLHPACCAKLAVDYRARLHQPLWL